MFINARPFREPGAAEGGGGLPPTLSEILPDNSMKSWSPAPADIQGGDGSPKPSELDKAAAAKEEADKAVEESKKQPPAEGAAESAAEEKIPGEGEDDQDAKQPDTEEAAEEGTVDPKEFFEAVDQLTGEPVAVEYGEVDPLSPEGVAIRDKAIRKDEVVKFENHLKAQDPRAYAYFLHRSEGGDDESFFAQKTVSLPDEEFFKNSVESQSKLYKQSLIDRGVDEDIADSAVAKAIKDNTLTEKSTRAYNDIRTSQEQQLKQMEAEAQKEREVFQKECDLVLDNLNGTIDSGSMKFIVPDAKKPEFKEFVRNSLRHEDNKFYAVTEIGSNPKNVLESLYFQYIKGDLSALIEKRAETKTVQRLKLGVQKARSGSPKSSNSSKLPGGYVPFGDI